MTNEEILAQVAKYEKGLNNPSIPDGAKATIRKNIENLKSQLTKVEAAIEKKEEKLEKEEIKVQEDLEAAISKMEKGLSNPNIPAAAKEMLKKKLAAAKEELAKQKKELKEDKKEAAEEKKEIKEAVKKVEEVEKKVRKGKKAPTPRIPIPKLEEKKREDKSKGRKAKLKGIITDLEALIKKNKELKKYIGAGVDLKKDAGRAAKPFGYRFVGKYDYRVPTEAQIKAGKKRGTIDYEGRPNRSDKYPSGVNKPIPKSKGKASHLAPQLADGGMMAKGGSINDDEYLYCYDCEIKGSDIGGLLVWSDSITNAREICEREMGSKGRIKNIKKTQIKTLKNGVDLDNIQFEKKYSDIIKNYSYKLLVDGYYVHATIDFRYSIGSGYEIRYRILGKDVMDYSFDSVEDAKRFAIGVLKERLQDDKIKKDLIKKIKEWKKDSVYMADGGMMMADGGGVQKERYKIIRGQQTFSNSSDWDDSSAYAYLVVDTQRNKTLAEFDLKKDAQDFLYDYQMRYDKMADGGMASTHKYTISEAKKMLDAEKSKNEGFSWFVPDVDYEGDDNDQEYGVHLSDKGLLDLADEIYKKGGKMAKGGYVTDLDEVVASSDLKEELKSKMKEGDEIVAFSYTNYGGSFFDKVAIEYFKENHPKNIVFEKAAYNGQNAIVFGKVAKDFLEETEDYPLGYEYMESFYSEMENEQEYKDYKFFLSDIKNKYTVKKDALDWLMENKSGYYSMQPDGLDFSYDDLEKELEEEGLIKRKKMAKGGMMAKGGKVKVAEYLVTLTDEDGFEDNVVIMAKSEDDAVYQAEKIRGYESSETGVVMLTDFDGNKIEYAKGGKVKDYNIDKKEDGERFAKPRGYRWKDSAVGRVKKVDAKGMKTDKKVTEADLAKTPSDANVKKYKGSKIAFENRLSKSDKRPSRKYLSL